jgi:hypothetical protein
MSREKPTILSKATHDRTRAQRKLKAEEAFQAGGLPKYPPAELRGMKAAQRTWRMLIRANAQLPANLFNTLDKGFLINYCRAVEAKEKALELELECHKSYSDGQIELDALLKARTELRMATRLVADLSRQLYASPRSRSGVNPGIRELTAEEIIDRELQELDIKRGWP